MVASCPSTLDFTCIIYVSKGRDKVSLDRTSDCFIGILFVISIYSHTRTINDFGIIVSPDHSQTINILFCADKVTTVCSLRCFVVRDFHFRLNLLPLFIAKTSIDLNSKKLNFRICTVSKFVFVS